LKKQSALTPQTKPQNYLIMFRFFIYACLTIALFAACTKSDITRNQTHTNQVVEDNTAPPFNGVSTLQVRAYVNKAFIDLRGREPVEDEAEAMVLLLENNGLSDEAKDIFLQVLMVGEEYYARFWDQYSAEMLQGLTRDQISGRVQELEFVLNLLQQQGDEIGAAFIQQELNRTRRVFEALPRYAQGEADISEFMASMVNNEFFENINMGSENFTIACFEHFYNRKPTDEELDACQLMINAFTAQVFMRDGNNKDDLVEILTTTPEFYQGLVIDIYRQLLARDPDSQEMTEGAQMLLETKDYKAVQQKVMKTEEYAGF